MRPTPITKADILFQVGQGLYRKAAERYDAWQWEYMATFDAAMEEHGVKPEGSATNHAEEAETQLWLAAKADLANHLSALRAIGRDYLTDMHNRTPDPSRS